MVFAKAEFNTLVCRLVGLEERDVLMLMEKARARKPAVSNSLSRAMAAERRTLRFCRRLHYFSVSPFF
jgi:hypothetical protein